MQQNQKLTRQLFFTIIGLALIINLIYFISTMSQAEATVKNIVLQNAPQKAAERERFFQEFMEHVETYLYSFNESPQFNKYLQNPIKEQSITHEIFYMFTKSHKDIMQFRYIDKDGFERIRVDQDIKLHTTKVIEKADLQNKANRYYFADSKTKPLEKVWWSNLDLNIEHGAVEVPFKPTLRAMLPLEKDGQFNGILIINLHMKEFLEQFMDAPLYDFRVINETGEILVSSFDEESWGNYKEEKFTVKNIFPNELTKILNNTTYNSDSFYSYKLQSINTPLKLYIIFSGKEKNIKTAIQNTYVRNIINSIVILFITLLVTFIISRKLKNKFEMYENNKAKYIQTIQEEKEKLDLATSASKTGIWTWNLIENKLIWDNYMYELYGVDTNNKDLLYSAWEDALHPEDKEQAVTTIQNALANDELFDTEFRIITPQKDIKYIKATALIQKQNGVKINMIGTNQDITSEKLYLQEIERQKTQLRQNVLYSRTDLNGIITDASDIFCSLSGYSKDELIGSSHNIVKHPDMDTTIYKELWKSLLDNKPWEGEIKNKAKDGHSYWVFAKIAPEYDLKGQKIGYYSIRQDITAQKNYMEQQAIIEQQNKMAAMGEMIGNIAHQWRQPLSAISIAAGTLGIKYETNTLTAQDVQEMEKNILSKTEYLSKTIDTFRDFIKGGEIKENASLCEVIEEAIYLVRDSFMQNHIHIHDQEHCAEICGRKIPIIKHELEQVIINILNNSKDAIKEKNIEEGWVKIIHSFKDNNAIITIIDNAGGIPKNVLPHIFEPYFTTKHQSQGTGLGLHMSYKIITQSFGGRIWAENCDSGAMFIIEIPLN